MFCFHSFSAFNESILWAQHNNQITSFWEESTVSWQKVPIYMMKDNRILNMNLCAIKCNTTSVKSGPNVTSRESYWESDQFIRRGKYANKKDQDQVHKAIYSATLCVGHDMCNHAWVGALKHSCGTANAHVANRYLSRWLQNTDLPQIPMVVKQNVSCLHINRQGTTFCMGYLLSRK